MSEEFLRNRLLVFGGEDAQTQVFCPVGCIYNRDTLIERSGLPLKAGEQAALLILYCGRCLLRGSCEFGKHEVVDGGDWRAFVTRGELERNGLCWQLTLNTPVQPQEI